MGDDKNQAYVGYYFFSRLQDLASVYLFRLRSDNLSFKLSSFVQVILLSAVAVAIKDYLRWSLEGFKVVMT